MENIFYLEWIKLTKQRNQLREIESIREIKKYKKMRLYLKVYGGFEKIQ